MINRRTFLRHLGIGTTIMMIKPIILSELPKPIGYIQIGNSEKIPVTKIIFNFSVNYRKEYCHD